MSSHSPPVHDTNEDHVDDRLGVGLLVAATVVALVWANSPWHGAYESLLHAGSGLDTGALGLHLGVHSVVNDALMAVFFLSIGLELKRELVTGDLRDPRTAALPALAAVGGMVVPAMIYAVVTHGTPGARGWGIPMATDVAFALGMVALLGKRVPVAARLFLLTLAAVDDIGAIVVIAVAYTERLQVGWLAVAVVLGVAVVVAHRRGHHELPLHLVLGVALWYATYRSGVHATVAGVVAGLAATAAGPKAVAARWEAALGPAVALCIVPVFALVNAGVRIEPGILGQTVSARVAVGAAAGLLLGKPIGVLGASWIAVRWTRLDLPGGLLWRHLAGVGALAGIGFTVSLFVTGLAFGGESDLGSAATLGLMAASVLAAVSGVVLLGTVQSRAGARRTGEVVR